MKITLAVPGREESAESVEIELADDAAVVDVKNLLADTGQFVDDLKFLGKQGYSGYVTLKSDQKAPERIVVQGINTFQGTGVGSDQGTPKLTRQTAKQLQKELRDSFQDHAFSAPLAELRQQAIQKADVRNLQKANAELRADSRRLVAEVHSRILPHYGFSGDHDWMLQMGKAFVPLMQNDPEIKAEAESIQELLNEQLGILTKERGLSLQEALQRGFEKPEFQRRMALVRNLDDHQKRHAELRNIVRAVQFEVLPRFGFSASDQGVKQMLFAFNPLMHDPQIKAATDRIDSLIALTQKSASIDKAPEKVSSQPKPEVARSPSKGKAPQKPPAPVPEGKMRIILATPGPEDTSTTVQLVMDQQAKVAELKKRLIVHFGENVKLLGATRTKHGALVTLEDSDKIPARVVVAGASTFNGLDLENVTTKMTVVIATQGPHNVADTVEIDIHTMATVADLRQLVSPHFGNCKLIGQAKGGASRAFVTLRDEDRVPPRVIVDGVKTLKGVHLGRSHLVELTLEQARNLQSELLEGIRDPALQKRLQEFQSRAESYMWTPRYIEEMQGVLSKVHRQVLPRYGFIPDGKGVETMMSALREFMHDPDVRQLSEEITRILQLPPPLFFPARTQGQVAVQSQKSGSMTKDQAIQLQVDLRDGLQNTFNQLLQRYGFAEESSEGIPQMLRAVAGHLDDPKVQTEVARTRDAYSLFAKLMDECCQPSTEMKAKLMEEALVTLPSPAPADPKPQEPSWTIEKKLMDKAQEISQRKGASVQGAPLLELSQGRVASASNLPKGISPGYFEESVAAPGGKHKVTLVTPGPPNTAESVEVLLDPNERVGVLHQRLAVYLGSAIKLIGQKKGIYSTLNSEDKIPWRVIVHGTKTLKVLKEVKDFGTAQTPSFSKDQAVELQSMLLKTINTSEFQEKLKALQNEQAPKSRAYGAAARELLLIEQIKLLPHFGFTEDQKGLEDMFQAFGPLNLHPEVIEGLEQISTSLGIATSMSAKIPDLALRA